MTFLLKGDKMEERKQNIKCDCGKLVAIKIDGIVYVYCKSCKRQVPVITLEPRATEPRAIKDF